MGCNAIGCFIVFACLTRLPSLLKVVRGRIKHLEDVQQVSRWKTESLRTNTSAKLSIEYELTDEEIQSTALYNAQATSSLLLALR